MSLLKKQPAAGGHVSVCGYRESLPSSPSVACWSGGGAALLLMYGETVNVPPLLCHSSVEEEWQRSGGGAAQLLIYGPKKR